MKPSPTLDFKTVLVMLCVVVVPTAFAVSSVVNRDQPFPPELYASPYGYTISLLLFIVPAAAIGTWFLRHPAYHIERKAFWTTVGLLAPCGFALDTLLGNSLFTFPNTGATLGIHGPGFDLTNGWRWNIPIEEYGFYTFGFLAILFMYIWCDLYWVGRYCHDNRPVAAAALPKLLKPHWGSIVYAILIVLGGILYKKFGAPPEYQEGFPTYFTFLVLAGLAPMFMFFHTALPFINWRAFSIVMFLILLISLLWEGTLGVPYQWWGYIDSQMLGLRIKPWANLPIEEPFLWTVVTWATIIFYEVIRLFWLMKRPVNQALFGAPATDTQP